MTKNQPAPALKAILLDKMPADALDAIEREGKRQRRKRLTQIRHILLLEAQRIEREEKETA